MPVSKQDREKKVKVVNVKLGRKWYFHPGKMLEISKVFLKETKSLGFLFVCLGFFILFVLLTILLLLLLLDMRGQKLNN